MAVGLNFHSISRSEGRFLTIAHRETKKHGIERARERDRDKEGETERMEERKARVID